MTSEYSVIYGSHQYCKNSHTFNKFLPSHYLRLKSCLPFSMNISPTSSVWWVYCQFCSFNKSTWSRISTVPWPLPFRSSIIIGNYQCNCRTYCIIIGDYQCHWRELDVPASINNGSQGRGVALKLKLFRWKSSFFQIFCFFPKSFKLSCCALLTSWGIEWFIGLILLMLLLLQKSIPFSFL